MAIQIVYTYPTWSKYPANWKKISRTIRRVAQGHCEWCHQPCENLSVHHIGTPRPTGCTWTKGTPYDKHDVRRENLVALCPLCHSQADHLPQVARSRKKSKARRALRHAAHAALGIGTGLVPVL